MKASIDHLTFYTQNKTPIMLFEYILCIQVETGVIGLIFKARNSKTGISSIKQTKIHKVEIESIFSSVSPLDWMHIMIWFNIHKYICKIIIFLSKVPSNQVEQLSMWFWSYLEFFFLSSSFEWRIYSNGKRFNDFVHLHRKWKWTLRLNPKKT